MQELEVALEAARAAGALLRERFDQPRTGVGTKSSATDLVTDADRAAEAVIIRAIREVFPDDDILSEEGGLALGTGARRWVIDPLDGTTNFVFGVPQWAVSIACEDDDGGLIGVVYDPLRDEMFASARAAGATMNGVGMRVTEAADLSRALIATGFSYQPDERATAAAILPQLLTHIRDIRRAGAAALDLAWVALGRYDGYYETPIEHHDVAAGMLLVTESGGRVASLPTLGAPGVGLVAAGPGIFDRLSALVEGLFEPQGRSAPARGEG